MKRNIWIMYFMALLQGMVFYGPVATLYRQARGVSVFQITIIEGISLALCLLLEIPWGILADRIGYRKTIVFCSFLYFASKIVFWQATDFLGFLAERVMLSVVFAGISGVDSAILYLSSSGKDMQKIFGRYNAYGMLGLLFSSLVFSVFVRDDYALAGLLTVISYGIAAVLSLGICEVKPAAVTSDDEKPMPFIEVCKETFRNKTLILFLIAVALVSEAHQTITVFLNQLQYEKCGMDNAVIGIVYGIATVIGLLSVCSSAVTKRMGEKASFIVFCAVPAAACLLLGVTRSAIPSVCGVFALRISDTLFQPLQERIQNEQVRTRDRATALSLHSMLINCVASVTNLLFGMLADFDLPAAFFFGGGICTLSLILFAVWLIGRRSSDKNKIGS